MPRSKLIKFSPLLAIVCLTVLATAVVSFSALATVAACWRQAAAPQRLELAAGNRAGPRQRFLSHADWEGAGQLLLYPADSEVPLASIRDWPLPDSLGPAAPFYASPLPLDSNYDGFVDQLVSVDLNGRVWLTAVFANHFGASSLLADLTHTDWRFIQTAGLFDLNLPLPLRPDGLPARYKLLLLVARNTGSGEDALVALRLPAVIAAPALVQFAELVDRSLLADSEHNNGLSYPQWQALMQAAGWWVRLSGQLTQPPQVIAGVIYSAVASSDFSAEDCASQSGAHNVVAMHLHSAGLVYNQRYFRLANGEGQLKLQQQNDGSAALILQSADQQQTVLSNLLTIAPACPDCTEVLRLEQFPRWLKLATYRQETGAH
ncbi:hypothetical protein WG68_00615 [Arsukibacterium ikkense]|uniref:Uncharacterized protein n=1 Tax=Arsukibacterium ikkense TaxID=336831 RepID=A0A0M2VDJ1_9GAMM|nr:hypothetical protein [Arsukibacterium ikkense]KKO47188.1 hypothetical protein WG68_00615 [Arsukibacterium ikkense]